MSGRWFVYRQPPEVAEVRSWRKLLYQIDMSEMSPKIRRMLLEAFAEAHKRRREEREARADSIYTIPKPYSHHLL